MKNSETGIVKMMIELQQHYTDALNKNFETHLKNIGKEIAKERKRNERTKKIRSIFG